MSPKDRLVDLLFPTRRLQREIDALRSTFEEEIDNAYGRGYADGATHGAADGIDWTPDPITPEATERLLAAVRSAGEAELANWEAERQRAVVGVVSLPAPARVRTLKKAV